MSATGLKGPDFFLVGAPKSGTTAMADYLSQHPQIGMCERKETHYFASDLFPRMAKRIGARPPTREEYLAWFSRVQDRPHLGEASVWYLYSPAAPRRIADFCPHAQAIVMLRDPVEMLPALHSEFIRQAIEPVEEIEQALAHDAEREREGAPTGFPPRSYRSAVRYAEQLRRYFEVFGRDRVWVLIYDDFRDRTADSYGAACEFLGVDMGFAPEFRVVNANRRSRSQRFERFVKRPPEPLRRALHAASSQRMRSRSARLLSRSNTRFQAREPISDELARALRSEFSPEVDELRALLGLELSSWPGGARSRSPVGGG